MKFEQLLQVYWSKGFLYSGKVYSFDATFTSFFYSKPGISFLGKRKILSRFEFSFLVSGKQESFNTLPLDDRKVLNMYFSQITSINHNLFELTRYNVIRLYLIKTFKGRAQALGKPCRGQRTWSNAKTSYRESKILRFFIQQVKKNNKIEKKKNSLNVKLIKKKTRKVVPKIKMIFTKKLKNLWF